MKNKCHLIFLLNILVGFAKGQQLDFTALKQNIIAAYTLNDAGLIPLRKAVSAIPFKNVATDQVVIEVTQKAMLNEVNVQKMVDEQNEDGSWKDINYADKARSAWAPKSHTDRLLYLATAYSNSNAAACYKKPYLQKAILNGLHYWFKNDFIATNWWYNDIGIPKSLAPIALMMQADLSATDIQHIVSILDRSKFKMTGQNKVWLAGNIFMKAVLTNNQALALQARDTILSVITTDDEEGIQADFSFHQHGAQQQFGNYGLSYVTSMSFWSKIFANSPLQISNTQQLILRELFLKAYRHIFWKGMLDVNSLNRQAFKYAQEAKGLAMCFAMYDMMRIDTANKNIYSNFINQQLSKKDIANPLGNTFFWRSDMSVHQAKDWFASIKMSSTRVIGAEAINSENKQGYYQADGATYILTTGKEYNNIFPFWNWRKLPGVTCYQSDKPVPEMKNGSYKNGSFFSGGLSSGKEGIATTIIKRDSITAYKSWFFINNSLVCLGAGISSVLNEPIGTSINQTYLRGSVIVKEKNKPAANFVQGARRSSNIEWVYHHAIGYYFLQPTNAEVSAKYQVGSWNSIASMYPPDIDSAQVFYLGVNHGNIPTDAGYAYVILPNKTENEIKKYVPDFSILKNNKECQAITSKDGKQLMIVAYKPYVISFAANKIEMQNTGVYYFKNVNGKWHVQLSDPTQQLQSISFTFNNTTHKIDLPQSKYAGQSINKVL